MGALLPVDPPLPDIQVLRKILKFTGSVSLTVKTIVRMVGEQQFHIGLSCPEHPWRVGPDIHGTFDGKRAGRNQVLPSFHLHHTHPAGTGRAQVLHGADGGNMHAMTGQGGKNGLSMICHDGSSVYLKFYSHLSYL
jgi:hypothetical protein